LTPCAFARLLAWLDDGLDSHGQRYVEMRRRLVAYFARRNRWAADELADETLNRVARTLGEDGTIAVRPPARYCYVIARYVLLEDCRRERARVPAHDSWPPGGPQVAGPVADGGSSLLHDRLDWLDRHLQLLKPGQRELIVEYYADAGRPKIERRRALARRLGISMNALAIRAWRIRDGLVASAPLPAAGHGQRRVTATS